MESRLLEKKQVQELNKDKKKKKKERNVKYWKFDGNKYFMLSISHLVNTYGNF